MNSNLSRTLSVSPKGHLLEDDLVVEGMSALKRPFVLPFPSREEILGFKTIGRESKSTKEAPDETR